ncbi:hypothetical protein RB195_015112 [Necator americanus]|uniref:Endonuclease/exonuclease/phosphatase domain-containing protein n=1 Tax=Necator americanus TaxID=51031 RepID=A0ABR1E318_NECAM
MSTDTDLHALLEAAERIRYNVVALQETKSRRSDVRWTNDVTLVTPREKALSRNEDSKVDYDALFRGPRACAEATHGKLGTNFESHRGTVGSKEDFEA